VAQTPCPSLVLRAAPVDQDLHDPRLLLAEYRPITGDELVYGYKDNDKQIPGLNDVVAFPGLTNAWTMPIKTRIDMLATGIKTPVGIKIMGDDLQCWPTWPSGSRQPSASCRARPARIPKDHGRQVRQFNINRDEIARYGLRVQDVQEVILTALGGMTITNTVEGLERYPVNLRYKRELRDNIPR